MFAEVYKKDSLQDEEYAECYAFDKRILLSKTEIEPYASDYDENIIKSFHQKQSSYAQSEGYHSYVSSNDSAIAPFSDRSQIENDFTGSMDEGVFVQKNSNVDTRSSVETKWRTPFSSCPAMKNANYERYNSQHIAHSARVQTPQKLHSETILYLDGSKTSHHFSKDKEKHSLNYSNSQLRKLYPLNTYSVQPQNVSVSASASASAATVTNISDFVSTKNVAKFSTSKSYFDLERQQIEQNQQQQQCTEYTFLDPSKKRVVSSQNLKVIQKQALISYYERHHSTWRSEPQLCASSGTFQSSSRPRLPTPTSCRAMSSSDNEETNSNGVENLSSKPENLAINNFVNATVDLRTEYSSHGSMEACNQMSYETAKVPGELLKLPIEDKVPDLPPKKGHLRSTVATRRLSSPDLPPPSPPPVVEEEIFIPDEPFPPPPSEAVFMCDNSKVVGTPKSVASAVDCDILSKTAVKTSVFPKPEPFVSKARNLACSEGLNESVENINLNRTPPLCERQSTVSNEFHASSEFVRFKAEMSRPLESNRRGGSRLSSSSFKGCSKWRYNDSNVNSRFIKGSLPSDLPVEKLQNPCKLPVAKPVEGSSSFKSTRNCEGNQIEQKVKAIRSLFEDKFKKSINSKNFQFPSFSFMHSDKFPSKLDPRFPRTSYQLSQSSNQREFRDSESRISNNVAGTYKSSTSPTNTQNGISTSAHHFKVNSENDYENTATVMDCSRNFDHKLSSRASFSVKDSRKTIGPELPYNPRKNKIKSFNNHSLLKSSPNSFNVNNITDSEDSSTVSAPYCNSRSQSTSPNRIVHSVGKPLNISSSNDSLATSFSTEERLAEEISAEYFVGIEHSSSLSSPSSRSVSPEKANNNYSHPRGNSDENNELFDENDVIRGSREGNRNFKIFTSTTDAASQTDIDIAVAREQTEQNVAVLLENHSSIIYRDECCRKDELQRLYRDVTICLVPTSRLYKILEYRANSRKSIDYVKHLFQTNFSELPPPPPKDLPSNEAQSEDTRLLEGSIAHEQKDSETSKEKQLQLCDSTQNITLLAFNQLQQNKKNLIQQLTCKMNSLKVEKNEITNVCQKNDELGEAIFEKITQSVNAREASKYKLHVREVGQITNLLLGLGGRLAKVENAMSESSENQNETEKAVLESKRDLLLRQLEDAKDLKKNIDRRSGSILAILQKHFSESELNDYQYFIKMKPKILIDNRNISDQIAQLEQHLNALKEDMTELNANTIFE